MTLTFKLEITDIAPIKVIGSRSGSSAVVASDECNPEIAVVRTFDRGTVH